MPPATPIATPTSGPKCACDDLVGATVEGTQKPGSWHVVEKIVRSKGASGGNFSVGYRVRHDDGTEAFMKATDLALLAQNSNMPLVDRIQHATYQYQFERDVLLLCRGNNLDKIVLAMDHGEFTTVFNGAQDVVFYLIFEMADGDATVQSDVSTRLDYVWSFNAMWNLAIAVQQLHTTEVSHNDIKPSNVLRYNVDLQKLGDLGRAVAQTRSGPFDSIAYPGDRTYRPPEHLYRRSTSASALTSFDSRKATDLYLLGSVSYFFLTGQMITPVVLSHLRNDHLPQNWNGEFDDVLPYWRDAFARALMSLESEAPKDSVGKSTVESGELITAVTQLCEPDPAKRGHPLNRRGQSDKFGVDRYIALFDKLRRRMGLRN
ncbi:MAG: hypothetical protein GKS03_03150 [Alphaproteobacteria bacterium]|nr:hypothetical protein [Alphaproteobacteria bacterium]